MNIIPYNFISIKGHYPRNLLVDVGTTHLVRQMFDLNELIEKNGLRVYENLNLNYSYYIKQDEFLIARTFKRGVGETKSCE